MRKFEVVSRFKGADDLLPKRGTKFSAGYDLVCAEEVVIPSMYKGYAKPMLVSVGVKAYMEDGEVLMVYNRSSSPLKRGLILTNGVGIIDKDYVDNPDNEGEIFVQLLNTSQEDVYLKRGERIAQAIFMTYNTTDNEEEVTTERKGGHGSTGEQ